ncbi:MAG: ribose-phosphate pyrophosphokinase [Burkholderiales bacterium]|nr:ribose-phosphate pyrophosphokinase [Burkholderiales bacterium]
MDLQLFSLDPGSALAAGVARELGAPLSPHEDRNFEDGEHKLRPLVDPRGADAFVIASLHGGPQASPHDKLCLLLMFLATLRDHGAARVTAVVPYLAYARKDRQTKPFDPLGLRYVAQLFEAMGTAQLIVLEAHNVAAFQSAFRCPTVHIDSCPAFDALAERWAERGPIAVASPDPGGVKRALLWREHLEVRLRRPVGFAMIDKRRSAGVVSGGHLVAGEVEGQSVLLFDDLIASGETMRRGALALREHGAQDVIAVAAHGLFIAPAADALADPAITEVAVTDSVPPFRLTGDGPLARKLHGVSVAALFAQSIRACHAGWAP